MHSFFIFQIGKQLKASSWTLRYLKELWIRIELWIFLLFFMFQLYIA